MVFILRRDNTAKSFGCRPVARVSKKEEILESPLTNTKSSNSEEIIELDINEYSGIFLARKSSLTMPSTRKP
jgi:hypothetical protein